MDELLAPMNLKHTMERYGLRCDHHRPSPYTPTHNIHTIVLGVVSGQLCGARIHVLGNFFVMQDYRIMYSSLLLRDLTKIPHCWARTVI